MSSEGDTLSAEYVRHLGTDELIQWLRDNSRLSQRKMDAALKVIAEQDIEGANFLKYTRADWKDDGLSGGVADSLVQIAQRVLGTDKKTIESKHPFVICLYSDCVNLQLFMGTIYQEQSDPSKNGFRRNWINLSQSFELLTLSAFFQWIWRTRMTEMLLMIMMIRIKKQSLNSLY
jgi:hypothetical protein